MDCDLIIDNIERHLILCAEEKETLAGFLQAETVKKKALLQAKGDACHYIYFVNQGMLRAYFLDESGKESTIMFAVRDWWITDMYAFADRQPAMLHIEAVKPTQLLKLSIDDMDALLAQQPRFERFFRIIFQKAYIREQLRTIRGLSQSAEERYQYFLTKYPHIAQHLTQKQIASYLGITPEFLSTIRANRSAEEIS